jgi:hypothetical protein
MYWRRRLPRTRGGAFHCCSTAGSRIAVLLTVWKHPQRFDGIQSDTVRSSFNLQCYSCAFYVHRAAWRDSDYIDYFQCLDMGYADAVVTKRGLATAFREAERHSPGIAPAEVYT